jgi:transposase
MERQPRTEVSTQLRTEVLERAKDCTSIPKLAAEYGLHRTTVTNWIRKEKLVAEYGERAKSKGGARAIAIDEQQFREYIEKNQGLSLAALTADYPQQMHPDTFRRHAKRLGIVLNKLPLKRIPYSTDELEDVIALQLQGKTLLDIAIILDRPYASLVSTLSRYKKNKARFKSSCKTRIVKLANQGYDTEFVANHFGLTPNYVYKVLREGWTDGLLSTPPAYPTPRYRQYTQEGEEQLEDLPLPPSESHRMEACWYCQKRSLLTDLITVKERFLHTECHTQITRLQQFRDGTLPELMEVVVKQRAPLTKDEIRIAQMIDENPSATYRELSSKAELALDSVFYIVKKLLKHGVIKRPKNGRVSNHAVKYITLIKV